ncbi:YgaP-like transmembrane domain [Microvirga solisilvae]|uniref:YgaP-like transmembrane domain n=1 Tax=Microvirga solisilvae TaxID=2919498 RepID=UPI003C6D0161
MANIISSGAGALMNGEPNLSTTERGLYMVAGLGLAAAAAKPRPNPLLNILALAGGSYLAWRGYAGNCPIKAALTGSHDHA